MIKKINKLKNFGIFHDFSWQTDLPEFKKFNLIYGWNYSGKTLLSRVFRCFELGKLHEGYESTTFEVELENGSKHNQSQLSQSFAVRVFNSDFIRENLKWEAGEEGIEPVLLLGEENIKLERQLKEYRAKLEEKVKRVDELSHTVKGEKENIETGLTDNARGIKNTLKLPDYDKRNFEPIVKDVVPAPETNKLSDDEFQSNLTKYNSTEKKETIPEITLSIPDMPALCNQTETILKTTAAANIIERLKKDPILEKWVREGKELHEDKSYCEFCGGQLPVDLMDRLNAHFSEEYDRLLAEINQFMSNLKDKEVSQVPLDKARFYSKLSEKYEQEKEQLHTVTKAFKETIEELLKKLEIKRTKPFEAVAFERPKDITNQLKGAIKAVNVIIQTHNRTTAKSETERETAKDKLIKYYASEFAIRTQYSQTHKEIERKETEIGKLEKEQVTLKNEIDTIEQQLSDAVKGAEKINEFLRSYFGTDEIKMTIAEDDKFFKLERSGHRADNLSEGEKTAIAFSHFMTTLEDKNTTLSDTIVFIDDPVSSLDCNHLFHTYAFIKSELVDCKQLFISTHNYEFFNLIKAWRERNGKYPNTSLYLIEKTKNGKDAPFKSNLKELPAPLSKFKSEYIYLFSLLYKFNENRTTDYDYLYILPNLVRRYLEAYIGFRTLGGLKNLSILITNEIEQGKIYKFINEYSHNQSQPRLLHFPDFSECKNVVEIVLRAVQDKDKDHYEALVKKTG